MKKNHNLEYIISFGMILVFGAILSIPNLIIPEIGKLLLLIGSSLVFILFAIYTKKKMQLNLASTLSYILGCLAILFTMFFLQNSFLQDSWFAIKNNGLYIFLMVIALLASLLVLLGAIFYKKNYLLYVSLLCFILAFLLLFRQLSLTLSFLTLLICAILTILNYLHLPKIADIARIASLEVAVMGIIFFKQMPEYFIPFCFINIMNIEVLLYYKHEKAYSYFLWILYFAYLVALYLTMNSLTPWAIPLTVSLIVLTDFVATKVNILKPNNSLIIKSLLTLALAYYAFIALNSYKLFFVSSLIIFIGAFLNSYVLKNDQFAKKLFAYKLSLLVFSLAYFLVYQFNLANLLNINADIIIALIVNTYILIIYNLINNRAQEHQYLLVIGILFAWLLFHIFRFDIIYFLVSTTLLILDFVYICRKKDEFSQQVFYLYLLVFIIIWLSSLDFGPIKYLICGLLMAAMMYYNRHNKVGIGITLPLFWYTMSNYIEGIVTLPWLYSLISSLFTIIVLLAFAYLIIERDSSRDLFLTIGMSIVLYSVMDVGHVILSIYGLSLALGLVFFAEKYPENHTLRYVGLCFTIFNFIDLFFFVQADFWLKLLIIGLIIVIVGLVLNAKQNHPPLDNKKK